MINSVEEEVKHFELFKQTLLEVLAPQMEVLNTVFQMEQVVTCATERFISIVNNNHWDASEVRSYLLPYVMRAKCGLDRVLDEEDSWVGLYRDDCVKNPTVFEAPTIFMHDVIHWREKIKFLNRTVLLDFLADYPYILSGRATIDKPESHNVNDMLIMRGLLTDEFMFEKPIVGSFTIEQVREQLSKL